METPARHDQIRDLLARAADAEWQTDAERVAFLNAAASLADEHGLTIDLPDPPAGYGWRDGRVVRIPPSVTTSPVTDEQPVPPEPAHATAGGGAHAKRRGERKQGHDAPTLITPSDLRPPDEWLLPRVSTRITPEGTETFTTYVGTDGEAVRLAAEKVIADLRDSPRDRSPKTTAAQLVAHHIMHGEVLPDIAMRALAAAMSLNRRTRPREWTDVTEAVEDARKATASIPVARKQRAIVFDVVRWLSARGLVLYGPIFRHLCVALGLTDAGGRLRQHVRECVAPSPEPKMRLLGLEYVEPEDDEDDGARAVWREEASPRVGLRQPDLVRAAVRFEVQARMREMAYENEVSEVSPEHTLAEIQALLHIEREIDPAKQVTPPADLARWVAEELGTHVSVNTIRAVIGSPEYQGAVYSHVFWQTDPSQQWRWRRGR